MDVTSTARFLRYWQSIHARSRRVIACIPEEHLEWSPRADGWSPGDLVRHLAIIERTMFVETACGRPSAYRGGERVRSEGLETVLARYDRLHDESVGLIAAFPDSRLAERCTTPAGAALRVGSWLRAMIEHEVHHRAQIYTLLGMRGVRTPPLFGLTSEEVAARGRPDDDHP